MGVPAQRTLTCVAVSVRRNGLNANLCTQKKFLAYAENVTQKNCLWNFLHLFALDKNFLLMLS